MTVYIYIYEATYLSIVQLLKKDNKKKIITPRTYRLHY